MRVVAGENVQGGRDHAERTNKQKITKKEVKERERERKREQNCSDPEKGGWIQMRQLPTGFPHTAGSAKTPSLYPHQAYESSTSTEW